MGRETARDSSKDDLSVRVSKQCKRWLRQYLYEDKVGDVDFSFQSVSPDWGYLFDRTFN
jgi:hypothetical protein